MIQLLFALVVFGVIVYLINNLLPIDPKFKLVINCVIGLILLWWVLSFFGLMTGPGVYGGPYVRPRG